MVLRAVGDTAHGLTQRLLHWGQETPTTPPSLAQHRFLNLNFINLAFVIAGPEARVTFICVQAMDSKIKQLIVNQDTGGTFIP